RRARAWFSVCGGYAIILAVAYVGTAMALGEGGTASGDLAKANQQVEELTRASSMLKLQLRDALIKLNVARAVGDQPDWSLLLAALSGSCATGGSGTVLRSCHLEAVSDQGTRGNDQGARGKGQGVSERESSLAPRPSPLAPDQRYNLTLSGFAKNQNEVTQF